MKFLIPTIAISILFCCEIQAQSVDGQKFNLKYKFSNDSPIIYRFDDLPIDYDSIMNGTKIIEDEDEQWAMKAAYERYDTNNYWIISKRDSLFEIASTVSTDSLKWNQVQYVYKFYIDDKGNNQSTYLGDQINTLCGFIFKLPDEPVGIGSAWKTNVDDLSLNLYIRPDSLYFKDEVKLTSLGFEKKDTLAYISYDYNLFLLANINRENDTTFVKYNGSGVFSIHKGRWLDYNCILSVKISDLVMSQKYKLTLVNFVPENLYDPDRKPDRKK